MWIWIVDKRDQILRDRQYPSAAALEFLTQQHKFNNFCLPESYLVRAPFRLDLHTSIPDISFWISKAFKKKRKKNLLTEEHENSGTSWSMFSWWYLTSQQKQLKLFRCAFSACSMCNYIQGNCLVYTHWSITAASVALWNLFWKLLIQWTLLTSVSGKDNQGKKNHHDSGGIYPANLTLPHKHQLHFLWY